MVLRSMCVIVRYQREAQAVSTARVNRPSQRHRQLLPLILHQQLLEYPTQSLATVLDPICFETYPTDACPTHSANSRQNGSSDDSALKQDLQGSNVVDDDSP